MLRLVDFAGLILVLQSAARAPRKSCPQLLLVNLSLVKGWNVNQAQSRAVGFEVRVIDFILLWFFVFFFSFLPSFYRSSF